MNDEHADHSHAHLGHLVVVRMVHERAILAQRPFIFHRFAGLDVRLRQPADAVHAVGQIEAMPVNRSRHTANRLVT